MTLRVLSVALAGLIALSACSEDGNQGSSNAAGGSGGAKAEAGDKTIASGLAQNSHFSGAAKAAGLDSTLAGAGPYTVFAPTDEAFNALPAGTYENWTKPESRAALTGVLTYHVLPGVVLAEDIGKAIDNAKGKAVLATMGGGTVTATREGGNIVLTDSSGTKATVTKADDKFSNGVVHHVSAVLKPAES